MYVQGISPTEITDSYSAKSSRKPLAVSFQLAERFSMSSESAHRSGSRCRRWELDSRQISNPGKTVADATSFLQLFFIPSALLESIGTPFPEESSPLIGFIAWKRNGMPTSWLQIHFSWQSQKDFYPF